MPKQKTKKAIAKRVKVTGSGKLLRNRSGAGHLKSRKSPKRLRKFRTRTEITGSLGKQVREMLNI